jgi:hypothetical protein
MANNITVQEKVHKNKEYQKYTPSEPNNFYAKIRKTNGQIKLQTRRHTTTNTRTLISAKK